MNSKKKSRRGGARGGRGLKYDRSMVKHFSAGFENDERNSDGKSLSVGLLYTFL